MEGESYKAYEALLQMIYHKELPRGQKVSEAALVKRLHMSRTPIRTALTVLQQDGLIETKDNCYTRIADYDKEYVRQFGVVRLTLDIEAVRLAIYHGSDADFEKLEESCRLYEEASYQGVNEVEKAKLDCAFHRQIALTAKNKILIDMIDAMYRRVIFFSVYSDFNTQDKNRSLRQHQEILQAIRARDTQMAIAALKRHLYAFYDISEKQSLI